MCNEEPTLPTFTNWHRSVQPRTLEHSALPCAGICESNVVEIPGSCRENPHIQLATDRGRVGHLWADQAYPGPTTKIHRLRSARIEDSLERIDGLRLRLRSEEYIKK